MKQIETLHLIRSRCVELLEQAKLRTSGAWEASGIAIYSLESDDRIASDVSPANATYIANASVAFEAALESTIAAIDGTDEIMLHYSSAKHNALLHALVEEQRNDIIKAWQHLLP